MDKIDETYEDKVFKKVNEDRKSKRGKWLNPTPKDLEEE